MPIIVFEGSNRLNLTATGTIVVPNGQDINLVGVFVAQASATPTLQLADSIGNIANTFTPFAGAYYPLPCQIFGTLTITISGTVDCTVFYGND